jgi:hypothetical protein
MRFLLITLGAAMLALASATASRAITVTGSGATDESGNALSAQATFTLLSPTVLQIDLKNTATFTSGLVNTSVLTGLFFNIVGGSPTFTFTSANAPNGISSIISTNPPPTYGNPGDLRVSHTLGGWDYAQGSPLSGVNQNYGLGTAGFNDFSGNTSGGPGSPTNYGVVQAGHLTFADGLSGPHAGQNDTPLVQDTVRFVLTSNISLTGLDLGTVRFQYGTALSEGNFPGTPGGPTPFGSPPVPEPSTLAIAGLGALGLLGYGLRRRRTK